MNTLFKVRKLVIITKREINTNRALSRSPFDKAIEKNDLLIGTPDAKAIENVDEIYQIAIQRGFLLQEPLAPTMSPAYAVAVDIDKASKLISRVGFFELLLGEYNGIVTLVLGLGLGGFIVTIIQALLT